MRPVFYVMYKFFAWWSVFEKIKVLHKRHVKQVVLSLKFSNGSLSHLIENEVNG